jgi:hypothetical protein
VGPLASAACQVLEAPIAVFGLSIIATVRTPPLLGTFRIVTQTLKTSDCGASAQEGGNKRKTQVSRRISLGCNVEELGERPRVFLVGLKAYTHV